MSTAASPLVVAVLAPAVGRITVEPLTGVVEVDDRGAVISTADAAALEVALQLGETWRCPVVALSAGGALAEVVLFEARSVGADRAVRIDAPDDGPPEQVAAALADTVGGLAGTAGGVPFVVAGVHGSDVATASVPAYLAHHLRAEQALGLIGVDPAEPGRAEVVRRLDRGARERLAVHAPAVLSVEGSVATLRRAGLRAVLATDAAEIEVRRPETAIDAGPEMLPRPWRPPTQVVPGPEGATALERIRDLTGVAGPTRVAATIEAEPAEAADAILDQLGEWGLGPRAPRE